MVLITQIKALSCFKRIKEIPHFIIYYLFVVFECFLEHVAVFPWCLGKLRWLILIIEYISQEKTSLSYFRWAQKNNPMGLILLYSFSRSNNFGLIRFYIECLYLRLDHFLSQVSFLFWNQRFRYLNVLFTCLYMGIVLISKFKFFLLLSVYLCTYLCIGYKQGLHVAMSQVCHTTEVNL